MQSIERRIKKKPNRMSWQFKSVNREIARTLDEQRLLSLSTQSQLPTNSGAPVGLYRPKFNRLSY